MIYTFSAAGNAGSDLTIQTSGSSDNLWKPLRFPGDYYCSPESYLVIVELLRSQATWLIPVLLFGEKKMSPTIWSVPIRYFHFPVCSFLSFGKNVKFLWLSSLPRYTFLKLYSAIISNLKKVARIVQRTAINLSLIVDILPHWLYHFHPLSPVPCPFSLCIYRLFSLSEPLEGKLPTPCPIYH